MNIHNCSRQSEVKEMLTHGHWPEACPAELRAHLAACRSCSELLLISDAFQRSRAAAAAEAQLPAPGAIWWRAQLRRRSAALERVSKPILGANVFALSILVVVGVALVMIEARQGFHLFSWLGQSQAVVMHFSAVVGSGWSLAVLIPIFASLALVGAVVVYLAAER